MASGLKGEERIQMTARGKGSIATVYAEALQLGEVRGYVHRNDAPEKVWIDERARAGPTPALLRDGVFTVKKFLYDERESRDSHVSLKKGDIESELQEYYDMSEQIPALAKLYAAVDAEGKIRFSAGILLEAFPDSRDLSMEQAAHKVSALPAMEKMFDAQTTPFQILGNFFPEILTYDRNDPNKLNRTPVVFYCRCSRESFRKKLASFGERVIREWQKDKDNQFTCVFCNEVYDFYDADFDAAHDLWKKGHDLSVNENTSQHTHQSLQNDLQDQLEEASKTVSK